MRRNRILVVFIGFALLTAIMVMPAAAKTWYVDDDGGYDYTTIQGALNAANDGDTIFVYNGTYGAVEIFSLNTPNLTVIGEGADVVTYSRPGANIRIGDQQPSPGCIVEGFTIVNSPTGLQVYSGSPNCIIRNCVFEGVTADTGINIKANNVTFINNTIKDSTSAYGVFYLEEIEGLLFANNTIINNPGAAGEIYHAPNSVFRRNNFSSNGADIIVYDPGEGIKWYLNNFIDTSIGNPWGGPVPAVTYWNSTEQIEYTYNGETHECYMGNYWSGHSDGESAECPGIWNTPYVVPDSLGNDYRPLMAGYENYLGAPAAEDKSDLNVTAITTPANIFATESNSINVTIKNNGTGDAGAFNVSLSADGNVIDRTSVAGLSAGASTEVSLEWTPAASRTYELCVVADCEGAVDESDETNNNLTVQKTVIEKPPCIQLQDGWNFISTPKRLADGHKDASIVFEHVDTTEQSIFLYNAQTGGWGQMNETDKVKPLDGIWIHSNGTAEAPLVYDTNPLQLPPTKTLNAGWNAVGFSDTDSASANEALTSVEAKWSYLIGFDATNQTYETSIINNAADSGGAHSETRLMYPTKGYWLYMTEGGELAGISA